MAAEPPSAPRLPTDEKRLRRREKRRETLEMADVSTIGTVFPVAILLGLFGGQAIGDFFGYRQLGALIGLAVGIASGFYNVYKVIRRVSPPDEYESDAENGGSSDA